MLSKNLRYLRTQKGLSQEQLAQTVGISRSALADYEKKRSEPTASVLLKLAEYFEVNMHDLLKIAMDAPSFQKSVLEAKSLQNPVIRILTVTVPDNEKQNIEFVPGTAIAGYATNFSQAQFIGDLPHFSIPKLNHGTYRAFEIEGDSMPPIHQGFVVIGKYVEHFSDLKNGKAYVLVLKENGVVFKRIINEVKTNQRLILVSDNAEFLPYTVKLNTVLEAWEMVAFVGYPSKSTTFNSAILDKLQHLEQKIDHLMINQSSRK